MKTVIELYKQDIKTICKNWAAILVVVALCILPSLYAWFNIKACWDPYDPSATSNIKVAVVNQDEGSTLNGEEINLGDQIVAQLKTNKTLGWQFLDEQQANEELENEKIFAMVTIPKDFSENILSITTNDVKQGEIDYKVNEKINAIAPKITIKGAQTIEQNVSSLIVGTITEKLFTVAKDLGINLEDSLPVLDGVLEQVKGLQSKFGQLNTLVNTADVEASEIKVLLEEIKQDLPNISSTLSSANELVESIDQFITTAQSQIDNISPTITQDLEIIASIASDVQTDAQNVINAINSASEQAPELISNLITKVDNLINLNNSLITFLTAINNIAPNQQLTDIINSLNGYVASLNSLKTSLNDALTALNNGYTPDTSVLDNIVNLSSSVNSTAISIKNTYITTIQPQINNILNQAFNTASGSLGIIKSTQNKLPEIENILNQGITIANQGGDVVSFVKQHLPEIESFIGDVVQKADDTKDSGMLTQLITLITHNVEERANFLAHPIVLNEQSIFNMSNYGTAMTPFYTVLCLWVGMTLLVSMLKVDAGKKYSAKVNYFAKLLLFLTIAILQSLIASIGDLAILQIYCSNPILFVASMVFTAICFAIIVYTLVSVFGNIGKVLSIILLVLQVAASGGTYPVELMGPFFKVIHPFLPFTYAISMGREAIGGVVSSILIKDIVILVAYIILALLIGLILKPFINKLMEPFNDKLEESGLTAE